MTHYYQEHRCAQLVVVDPEGRLLLCRQYDREQTPVWATAGGELFPEETFPDAAIRTLDQVAGLSCPLGPLLRERETAGSAPPAWHIERYFLVRSPAVDENTLGQQDDYQGSSSICQWWTLAEMQAAPAESFQPTWLPELLASVLFSETVMPSSTARF